MKRKKAEPTEDSYPARRKWPYQPGQRACRTLSVFIRPAQLQVRDDLIGQVRDDDEQEEGMDAQVILDGGLKVAVVDTSGKGDEPGMEG